MRFKEKAKTKGLIIPDSVHGYLNEIGAILLRKDVPQRLFFDQFVLSCNI
jgi:hypothetical protein